MRKGKSGRKKQPQSVDSTASTCAADDTPGKTLSAVGQLNNVYRALGLEPREIEEAFAAHALLQPEKRYATASIADLVEQWSGDQGSTFETHVLGFAQAHVKAWAATTLEKTEQGSDEELLEFFERELDKVALPCPNTWWQAGYRLMDYLSVDANRANRVQALVDLRNVKLNRVGDEQKSMDSYTDEVDQSHPMAQIRLGDRWLLWSEYDNGFSDLRPAQPVCRTR